MARLLKRGKVYYSDLRIAGKRVQRALSTDRRIAEEKLADLVKLRGANKHGHAITGPKSYQAAKDRFFQVYANKSKITRRHYTRAMARLEDTGNFGNLTEITPHLLTDLYNGWKTKGRGLYVRNRDLECLIAFMRKAESWGMVPAQDWDTVIKLDPEPRGRLLFYSLKEFERLRTKIHGLWDTMAMLMAYAGLRPGEAFYLEWKDVDLHNRKIHIEAKPQYAHHVRDYERRTIPVHKKLYGYLKKVRRTGNFIVSGEGGKRPKTTDVLSTYFSRRVRAAGLKGSLYTLRHCFGSWLAQKGVPLQVIRDLMGHKSVTTTEIYSHLLPEMHQKAIDAIE